MIHPMTNMRKTLMKMRSPSCPERLEKYGETKVALDGKIPHEGFLKKHAERSLDQIISEQFRIVTK